MAHDNFHDFLPSLLAHPSMEELAQEARYTVERLSPANRRHYEDQVAQVDRIAGTLQGDAIHVFASAADGWGNYDNQELDGNVEAAYRLRHGLKGMGIPNRVHVVEGFTPQDVRNAVADPTVAHMMFIGHAGRAGVVSHEGGFMGWDSVAPADHLKRSLGVLGCAVTGHQTEPRFGFNLVAPDDGLLYGKVHGTAHQGEMIDLGNYHPLPTRLGTDPALGLTQHTV